MNTNYQSDKAKKTLWDFFINKHRFTSLLILVILALGTISVIQIPKESNPEVDIPFVVVNTAFPGASAQDVEELVTHVIEGKVLGISGVKDITSTSRESFSSIAIEFDPQAEGKDLEDEVQKKVNEAEVDLPEEVEDPVVRKIEVSDEPVFIFSLSGPYETIQLKEFAEETKDDIEKINGVSKVEIVGGEEREIKVIVNKAALDRYGLSISQVTQAIGLANADIPTGSIETAGADYTVRLAGRLLDVEDIKQVPIASINNTPVLVEDVSQVIDGYQERTRMSRLSVAGSEPLPAVSLSVFKTKGGNIIRVVGQVKETIEQAQASFLPNDIEIEVILDMGDYIRQDLETLGFSGLQTVIIILVLLLLFVGTREALLASLALPFSFLITFIFLPVMGLTLNFLSLFSLILALGILIDTAVVVIERMNVYIQTKDKSPKEAALLTVREFQWPLIAGTLTTVFAFVPMLIMSGIMGQYMRVIPITVTIVLLSSLFVGLAIIPALGGSRLKKRAELSPEKPRGFFTSLRNFTSRRIFDYGTEKYHNTLAALIESKRKRRFLTIGIIVLFFLSLSLPVSGILKMNMFPPEDADSFWVQVKAPINTPLEETSQIMEEVENTLLEEEQIKSFAVSVGYDLFSGNVGEHLGGVIVNLIEQEERVEESPQLVGRYQKIFDQSIEEAEVSLLEFTSGPPSAAPVDIGIRGESLKKLESVTRQLEEILKETPGSSNVQTNIEEAKPEFIIQIERSKAKLYGISTVELAQVLRNAVKGTTATIIRHQGEETDVVVKYALSPNNNKGQKTNNITINDLESLTIATPRGDIPLSAFTKTELAGGRPFIRHEDGMRTFRLTSYTEVGIAPIEVIRAFQEKIAIVEIPEDYEMVFGGEQEDIEQSFNDMFRAMILAIFLIAALLVLQFSSYRQPLFVLAAIPLAFIGVFPGLLLMGKQLSLPAIIGIVALAGIVVNNGIILVDMINRNRRAQMTMNEAVLQAGIVRFRPIILTSITTILGILPITLSSELWGGLGFAIIYGLFISVFLTLFVVPLLYRRFAEKKLE